VGGIDDQPSLPSIFPMVVAGVAASGAVALFYCFDNAVVGEKEEVTGKQQKHVLSCDTFYTVNCRMEAITQAY
jgi:hypothetical protein